MKYNKREYLKYVKDIQLTLKKGERPISFEKWKIVQPVADRIINKVNKIIK